MSKFVVVKEAPKDLHKGCHVIEMPTFIEEIRANANKKALNGLTGVNHLRSIAGTIGDKYDPNLTTWTVRPNLFEGRAFSSDEELSDIVLDMLRSQYPSIFDSYLNHQVKNRPLGTKLVYFVGPFQKTMAFTMNGMDQIEEKDVDVYLGLKEKKKVGKPAVSGKPEEQPQEEEDGDESN